MRRKTQAAALVAAVGTLGSLGGIAQAKTDTQVHSFDFPLEEGSPIDYDLRFRGNDNLSFDQFDASDGRTLNSVTFEVETTIEGDYFPDVTGDVNRGRDRRVEVAPGVASLAFESGASVGTFEFVAEADFDPFVFEDDAELIGEGPFSIDKSGTGSHTTMAVDDFLGNKTLPGGVGARMFVEYMPNYIGTTDDLRANGQVRLIYDFDEAQTPPPPTTIPTPTAAPAGMVLLGLAGLRRRR